MFNNLPVLLCFVLLALFMASPSFRNPTADIRIFQRLDNV
jgi:hypothetical protein